MASFLYTLSNCGHCADAKKLLAEAGESYQEILIDNPLLEAGITCLLKRQAFAPLLYRGEPQQPGELFILATMGDQHQFVRIVL